MSSSARVSTLMPRKISLQCDPGSGFVIFFRLFPCVIRSFEHSERPTKATRPGLGGSTWRSSKGLQCIERRRESTQASAYATDATRLRSAPRNRHHQCVARRPTSSSTQREPRLYTVEQQTRRSDGAATMPDSHGAVHTLGSTSGHGAVAQCDLQSRGTEKRAPPLYFESQTEASRPSETTEDDLRTATHVQLVDTHRHWCCRHLHVLRDPAAADDRFGSNG